MTSNVERDKIYEGIIRTPLRRYCLAILTFKNYSPTTVYRIFRDKFLLEYTRQTVNRTFHYLRDEGLVKQVVDSRERRRTEYTITHLGRQMVERLKKDGQLKKFEKIMPLNGSQQEKEIQMHHLEKNREKEESDEEVYKMQLNLIDFLDNIKSTISLDSAGESSKKFSENLINENKIKELKILILKTPNDSLKAIREVLNIIFDKESQEGEN